MSDLPIIQKTYDLIKWYVPILNRIPRDHKLLLGNRIITELYNLLDVLIVARYAKQKLIYLESLNSKLDILRYQTRITTWVFGLWLCGAVLFCVRTGKWEFIGSTK
ncbi:diversity-generating retroelement protein Avd [Nostoc sp. FACHB-110]|uniref:diversity-generating retroelement protein Avd n=1 Tax=Nostoc sp. FACHB-110 TaxID=2692834 RepID=UPI0016832F8D|nr:diversity-generating retroelement protein Avd [Nostoc sp. FACHB-110]MBD2439622.1 diversity-generating retroelement protein Avd [Nostoc sp. FACHB-110]